MTAYCMKDKKSVEMTSTETITMKNGRPAMRGTCPQCGGTLFRILPTK